MALSGQMMYYARDGLFWDNVLGQLVNRAYVSTFDGDVSRRFYSGDDETPWRYHPLGFDHAETRNIESNYYILAPILLCYRSSDAELGGRDITAFRLGDGTAMADGAECLVLESTGEETELREAFWVDPARDFHIVRVERRLPGKITWLNIAYRHHESHGWVPSSWTWVASGPDSGRIFEQVSATVTHYEINEDIPREEFQFTFPPGTMVRDMRSGRNYIQREGSETRTITPEEIARGAAYEELLTTGSGQAALRRRRSGAATLCAVLIMVALALALAWRAIAPRQTLSSRP